MNLHTTLKPGLDAAHYGKDTSRDALYLFEENWTHSLPGTPSPVAPSHRAYSYSSTLSPETPISDGSSIIDFNASPIGLQVAVPVLRKVNKITQLATSRNAVPAFGASGAFSGILSGSGVTKPVLIPNKHGRPISTDLQDHVNADLHNSNVSAGYIKEEGPITAPFSDGQLGSWTQRQIIYPVKTSAPPIRFPNSVTATYGFMPAEVAAKAAVPSPTPAFWPEQGVQHSKGPHKAAMAEAARAAAVKPTQHILFKAACRVDAPQRPGAIKTLQPLVGRRRVPAQPAKKDSPDLSLEDKIWRVRSKRAWIREQLRALRGFPKDSAYDEPWSDAFDMVQAMGEGLHLQTSQPGDSSDADEDGFSSDSDLHEQLLFDEEPAKPHASKAAPNLGPEFSDTSLTGMPLNTSPRPGNYSGLTAKGASNFSALTSAFQGAGLPMGNNQPTTIVGCAQELMRHQRSIELDTERAWQAKFSARKPAWPTAANKPAAAAEHRLLRNDSAFEDASRKGVSRAAIKQITPQVASKNTGAQWIGELLPAADFDTNGALTCAVIRITDERSGASRIILRGKKGQSEAQIIKAVEEQAALMARVHALDKPTVHLLRGGTMLWADDSSS